MTTINVSGDIGAILSRTKAEGDAAAVQFVAHLKSFSYQLSDGIHDLFNGNYSLVSASPTSLICPDFTWRKHSAVSIRPV